MLLAALETYQTVSRKNAKSGSGLCSGADVAEVAEALVEPVAEGVAHGDELRRSGRPGAPCGRAASPRPAAADEPDADEVVAGRAAPAGRSEVAAVAAAVPARNEGARWCRESLKGPSGGDGGRVV